MDTLRHIDYALFHFINSGLSNPVFDAVCPVLRNKLTWMPLYGIIMFYVFKYYGKRAWWLLAAAGVTILLSDQISSTIIKPLVHRLRPCNNPELKITLHLLVEHCGAGYSFVSSHAANHFALAAFLAFLVSRKKIWVPLLYLWAVSVAFAQVYVGVHFPADVLAGAVLGTLVGVFTGTITVKNIRKYA